MCRSNRGRTAWSSQKVIGHGAAGILQEGLAQKQKKCVDGQTVSSGTSVKRGNEVCLGDWYYKEASSWTKKNHGSESERGADEPSR